MLAMSRVVGTQGSSILSNYRVNTFGFVRLKTAVFASAYAKGSSLARKLSRRCQELECGSSGSTIGATIHSR